jgi:hypothetical protein
MSLGQRVALTVETTAAPSVASWNSANSAVAAVVSQGTLQGTLQSIRPGQTVITATLRYRDGSQRTLPVMACGVAAGGICAEVRTITVVP